MRSPAPIVVLFMFVCGGVRAAQKPKIIVTLADPNIFSVLLRCPSLIRWYPLLFMADLHWASRIRDGRKPGTSSDMLVRSFTNGLGKDNEGKRRILMSASRAGPANPLPEGRVEQFPRKSRYTPEQAKTAQEAWDGKHGIKLLFVDAATGAVGASIDLDALPVFDGMSVADGRIYLACQDGSLRCFAGANTKPTR